MWLLISVLCLQTSAADAECRPYARGPYLTQSQCREMIAPIQDILLDVAGRIGARVIFTSTRCEKGKDA